ncbi:MAG: hypothetical protein ABFR36_07210 [Acidobacteriota bacterium]
MKRTLVLLIAFVFIFSIVSGQTVDEIIKNHIKVKGGAAKLESVKSVKAIGKMVRMNMEMKFTMFYKKPGMTRTEVTFSDKLMVFAYDGKTAWQISPFTGIEGPQVMTGDQADDAKEQSEMFENPLIDYAKKGHKVELLGKDDLEGTEVFKLKLIKKDGKEIILYLDTENFIDLKTETLRVRKDGKEIKSESYSGDFKEVNGIMSAFSIKTKVNGMDMGNIVIESIEYDTELDDSLFIMPDKEEKK